MTDHDTCPGYYLSEFGTSEARKTLADEDTDPMLRRLVQDLDRQLAAQREKNEKLRNEDIEHRAALFTALRLRGLLGNDIAPWEYIVAVVECTQEPRP